MTDHACMCKAFDTYPKIHPCVIWNLISKLSTTDFRVVVFFFVVFSYSFPIFLKNATPFENHTSHTNSVEGSHLRISYWRPIELQSIRSLSAAGHWKSTALCHEPSYTTRSTRTFKSSLRSTLRVNGRCGPWNLQQDVSWALVGWMEFGKAKLDAGEFAKCKTVCSPMFISASKKCSSFETEMLGKQVIVT